MQTTFSLVEKWWKIKYKCSHTHTHTKSNQNIQLRQFTHAEWQKTSTKQLTVDQGVKSHTQYAMIFQKPLKLAIPIKMMGKNE